MHNTYEAIDSEDDEPVNLGEAAIPCIHSKPMMESQSTVVYLDFVKDVEEETKIPHQQGRIQKGVSELGGG